MKRLLLFFLTGVLLLVSCGKREAKDAVDALPTIFPDYADVTVPCTIAPLNFEMSGATHLQAVLINGEGMEVHADGSNAICIDETEWKTLLSNGGDIKVEVSVWDEEHPDGARYKPFTIHASKDEIDPWIVYRLLPPGYEGWNKMGIYQRNITNFEELTFVDNSADKTSCMNCHAVANFNNENYMYHLRGENGATIIHHEGKKDEVDLRKLSGGKHGSHNAWHPSGRYIVFSSNDTKQIFFGHSQDKIEVFDLWSDVFVYDVQNQTIIKDDRFFDSEWLETYPAFSPDGRWLYFCIASPVAIPDQYADLRYSIVRVPFDEKTGHLGDELEVVFDCNQRGATALMPRISPDGKFLLYTVSESGAFNLYHKESDFEMLRIPQGSFKGYSLTTSAHIASEDDSSEKTDVEDSASDEHDFVDCSLINSTDAESYHAWSSNGKWMMFSSKRIDGRYTRLFIAHFDGKKWSKPFLLPQKEPEHNTLLMMAYNVAEFLKAPLGEE